MISESEPRGIFLSPVPFKTYCKREESSFTPSKLHLSVKPGRFTAARKREMLKQTEERIGLFPYRNLPDSKSGFIFFSKRAKERRTKQTRIRDEMRVI
ncbi:MULTISPECIES: hypothetical protein [unclassified Akkermansia]|uniref:hypothetical protein n=1 Tax=unclassified Akkermansia TaxID=2608915 RepID=UPI00122F30E0|nr:MULTISPECIES: hypothetical protein [unclassified Akkermansia]KAA3154912.1 hypothetical protein F1995_06105 [Akkermansia sp. BIOML-A62]KAA3171335.1 hypothetical protein F2A09_07970 [Akkermansia sp. BIOML-A57]KAA3196361.1 hypothetical protein F2A00_06155 [Akkermansia sp. BIOML-A48]KAA3200587.1 hypothetical protein F1987_08335 [Akkermansia sp. BIOML-A47]KAA3209127.1 hypothetical protein F1997_07030 [Akkermansia sp. BIOML-A44]KAA3213842.1 hypothetical protein F1982_08085 [Akkermansia sp. BIOML